MLGKRVFDKANFEPAEFHRFICLGCGGTYEFGPVLEDGFRNFCKSEVKVLAVEVIIRGYCKDCYKC